MGWRGDRVAARAEEPRTTPGAEELLAGDGFGGRESQFSLVQSLVGGPHSRRWPHTHEYTGNTS